MIIIPQIPLESSLDTIVSWSTTSAFCKSTNILYPIYPLSRACLTFYVKLIKALEVKILSETKLQVINNIAFSQEIIDCFIHEFSSIFSTFDKRLL